MHQTILKSISTLKIDKAKSLNKKTLKTKGTEFLIFHSQNPKYPFVFCPLLALWVF
ncbi:hypothetical protein [Helicobacter pylori]|uniref:hypothetical protein n=1 Tax=Helicobacter pylori TaxID=210 RepID=UPI0013E37186|nr:hypothetical protein [Helicobacter pylori]